jgi:hypothetical protein
LRLARRRKGSLHAERTLDDLPNLLVHCGLCGQPVSLVADVEEPLDDEMLRALVKENLGESVQCERCHSILLTETGTRGEGQTSVEFAVAAEEMRKRMRGGVRWAVGLSSGARGSIWRVWAQRNEVYIAARSTAADMRISLHSSGRWRSAFTETHLQRPKPLISPERDRAFEKWTRPPKFAPGWTRGFSIIVPTSEVVPSEVVVESPDDVLWIAPPPEGSAVHFDILLSAPGATGSEGRGFATPEGYQHATHVLTAFDLENSERVWVVSHAEPMTPEQVAMVEELRTKIIEASGEGLSEALSDDGPHDLRAIGIGNLRDETRFYLDLAISKETARAHVRSSH